MIDRDSHRRIAESAVNKIERDLKDRRGLRHEWDRIDQETQYEIREGWIDIILASLLEADSQDD